ncbi:MAG: OsmC family protein [Acidobacteria bacterium]|nr:OsmC family protein [Acidobacteriota bacterium]
MAKPPIHLSITWAGDLRFEAMADRVPLVLDGASKAGPSPVEALALALAGCMAVDVVDILQKGRHQVRSLVADFTGERAPEPPSRYTAVTLHFRVGTDAPAHAIERAIELSHEKYCSVWHSLRQDIAFATTYEVVP